MIQNIELIDTHAHLAFTELDYDLKNVIQRALDCNVKRIVNIASGSGLEKIKRCFEISKEHGNVYNSVGVHPNEVDEFTKVMTSEAASYLDNPSTVAAGEVGLDFYRSSSNVDLQKDIFKLFIDLAIARKLPLVIHQRDAFDEVISILKEADVGNKIPFVFHCFGGNSKEADRILDMGGFISVTGIITFKKAHYLRETVARIPLERLMLETDSPYLSPEPKRGRRNEPAHIIYIAKTVAEIKGVSLEEVARATTENATKFFKL